MANIGRELRTLTVEPLQVPEPQRIEEEPQHQEEQQPVTVRED